MEKVNPNVVALSFGITASILSIICLILIAVLPLQATVKVVNSLVHGIDFSSIAVKNITFTGIIIGLVSWFLIAAVTGYIFAFIYNWVGEKL